MSGEQESPELYLVWSNEHARWWAPGSGYTPSIRAARKFSRGQAIHICLHAMPGQAARMCMIPDLPVRLADLDTLSLIYRSTYPDRGPEECEVWE